MHFWVNFAGWLERVSASRDAIPLAIATYLTIVGFGVFALVLVLGLIWLKLVANISRWAKIRVHDIRRRILIVALSAGFLAISGVGAFLILPHTGAQPTKTQDIADADSDQQPERNPPPSPITQQCLLLRSDKEEDVVREAKDLVREKGDLRLLGGPDWGYFQQFAKEIKLAGDARGVRIRVEPTSGSEENLDRLSSEENPGTRAAPVQRDVFENHRAKESFQVVHPNPFLEKIHVAVSRESKISAFSGLQSKNIGVVGSGSRVTLGMLLQSANVEAHVSAKGPKITPEEVSRELRERRIDAFFYVVGDPAPLFLRLPIPVRFLPIPKDLLQRNRHLSENFNVRTGLVYPGLDVPIETQGVWAQLVAPKSTDCRAVKFFKMVIEDRHHF
jgi:TRAP-type uncharacterized transport system substrate-binding protein